MYYWFFYYTFIYITYMMIDEVPSSSSSCIRIPIRIVFIVPFVLFKQLKML